MFDRDNDDDMMSEHWAINADAGIDDINVDDGTMVRTYTDPKPPDTKVSHTC